MPTDLLHGFYLGHYLVEPLKGQVTGPNGSNHVAPKAMETLLCLARHPMALVTRETLLEEVWGEGHGSQEALSHSVSELRHAFDDNHSNPHFIQTLPRRGYRLVVTPELVDDNTVSVILGGNGAMRLSEIGLYENLKRRGVLEAGLAYLAVGWLLMQVAEIVFQRLKFPDWTVTFVTVLVIAGFPLVLLFSWFLEIRDGRAVLHDLSPVDARRRRFSRTYVSIVGAFAIAGVGVSVYHSIVGLPESSMPTVAVAFELPPIVENSFAVLPFLNIDGGEETQVFANGLAEDVITRLSRIPGLHVATRGDSFSLSPNSSSAEVRQRLRVKMYLEGSVEFFGTEMRVTVRMIDAETGSDFITRAFHKSRQNFFEVRDEITALIVANIRISLPADLRAEDLGLVEDPSLDAYVLYRRGVEASRQPMSVDTVASALGWFDAALSVDEEYAAAHAAKCAIYVRGYDEFDNPEFVTRAESSCSRALNLNPKLYMVHTALGDLNALTGNYAGAEAAYRNALSIEPANVEALTGLGSLYARQGRLREAESNLRAAIDIHPGDASTYRTLGTFLFDAGRYEESAAQFEYFVALQPGNMNAYANLGGALIAAGEFAKATPAFQRAIEIQPTKGAYSNLGLLYYYLGNYEAAIESLESAVELQPNDYLAKSNLGDALWVAGRRNDARQEFLKAETLAQREYEVNPNDKFTMMDLAWIKAMLGKESEARQLIDRALEIDADDPYANYYNALVHLRSGDEEDAVAALEVAISKGYSKKLLRAEPHLNRIRDNPRFVEVVSEN